MTVPLRDRVEEYLRLRRALGFRLVREGRMLAGFAGYLEQQGTATVTAEHAITWAQLPQTSIRGCGRSVLPRSGGSPPGCA